MATDLSFSNVALLLHADGANGNTTVVDSSSSPKTLTCVGNAQISTAQSVFGGSSLTFDGTGDVISIPYHTDWNFGSANFTVEARVYTQQAAGVSRGILGQWITGNYGWFVYLDTSNRLGFLYSIDGTTIVSTEFIPTALSINTWYSFAVVRNGTTLSIFLDGALAYTNTSFSATINASTGIFGIGGRGDASGSPWLGYLDEIRITKLTARYTSAYTVLGVPFADSGVLAGNSSTSLLGTIAPSGGSIVIPITGLSTSSVLGIATANIPVIANVIGLYSVSSLNTVGVPGIATIVGNTNLSSVGTLVTSIVKTSNTTGISSINSLGTITTSGSILSLNLYRKSSGILCLASTLPVGGTLVTGYNDAALALLAPWYRVQDTYSFGNTSEFHPFNYYLGPPEISDVVNPDGTPTVQYGIGTILYLLAGQADDLVSVKDTSDYPRAIPSWNIVNDAANYSFIPAVLGSSNNNCPYIREIHSTDFYTIGLSGFTLTIDFRVRSVVNSSSNYLFYLGKLDNNFNGFALLLISYNAYSVSIGIVDSTNTEVYAETIDFDMAAHLNDNLEILFSRAAGSNDLVFELFSTNTLSWITKTQTKVDFTFPAFNTMAIGATSNTPTMYGNLDALFYKISLSVLNSTPIFPNGYNFTTINGTNTENILYRRKWSAPYPITYTPIEINFLDIPMAKKSTRGNALVTALVEVAHCNKYYIFELWIRPIVGIGEGPIYGPSTMLFRKEIDMTSRISTFTSSIIHPTVQWGGGVYKVTNSSTQPRGFIQSVKDTFGNTYQLAQSYFTVLEDMYSGINLPPPNSYYAFTDATGTYIKLYAPVPVANLLIEIANPTDVDLVYIVPKENLPIKDFQLSLVVGSTTDVVEGTYSSTLSYIEL